MTPYKPPHARSPRTRCALQYEGTQEDAPMWEEIQDMPGEIFDLTDEDINQFLDEQDQEEEAN